MSDSIDDRLMSSSSPEPENAAPTDTVRTEQGQQSSRDGDQNESWLRSHSSRPNSTSLLTQALAAHNKADEGRLNENSTHNPPEASTNPSLPLAPPPDNKANNGVSTANTTKVGTEQMAKVAPASAGRIAGVVSLGNTPISSTFNLQNMAHVNTVLTTHPAPLNGSRTRGTSLERTPKEKQLEGSSKGTHSTNPGDTALPPSPDAQSPITLDSNNPPTEGVRARYRSWRDVKPGMASEKAWSIGEEGSGISHGQVERSITKAMTGAEHNNRSRKASHTLGFFKEGLPEDKSKKSPSKSIGCSKEGLSLGKGLVGSDNGKQRAGQGPEASQPRGSDTFQNGTSYASSPPDRSRSTSHDGNPTVGLATQEGYFDASHTIETVSEEQLKSIPPQLLAEIRKHHNLTPGASKGSSFSRSIPVTASERSQPDPREGSPTSSKVTATQGKDRSNEDGTDLPDIKSNDEDEESGEEQISSALFVPHHTRLDSSEGDHHDLESVVRPRPTDSRHTPASQQWLEEHKVPSREIEKRYVDQEGQSQPLPVPSRSHLKEHNEESEREALLLVSDVLKLDHAVPDDGNITTAGEDFSIANTADSNPAGFLKPGNQTPADHTQHLHDYQIDHKQPLETIELIPYRHQVGGHTTLWRFSKRAVCKQLSNRENVFYEKVERYHPQLLKFLPRCV